MIFVVLVSDSKVRLMKRNRVRLSAQSVNLKYNLSTRTCCEAASKYYVTIFYIKKGIFTQIPNLFQRNFFKYDKFIVSQAMLG